MEQLQPLALKQQGQEQQGNKETNNNGILSVDPSPSKG